MEAPNASFTAILLACAPTLAAAGVQQPAPAGETTAIDDARRELWAKAKAEMQQYTATIPGTEVSFTMLPVPGGVFTMGAPEGERGRRGTEGPQRQVVVDPFWMGKCEVTWDEYEQWSAQLERKRRPTDYRASPADQVADGVSKPTPPYTDMTFGMGRDGYPAVCMTQHAAIRYCEWLSAKLEAYYRLPTEAEWEYACRAGTATAYGFGDDPAALGDYAWFRGNADGAYHPVGKKLANGWGFHDMHGNVSEWVIDQFAPYAEAATPLINPVVVPDALYPRAVRGGSFQDRETRLRSAARRGSGPEWKMQDPQIPQSVWYHTDAQFNGFRVVRPFVVPSAEERAKFASNVQEHDR